MIISSTSKWTDDSVNKICEYLIVIGTWLNRKPSNDKEFQFIRGKSVPMLINVLALIMKEKNFDECSLNQKLFDTVFD